MPTLRPFRDYDEKDVINLYTLTGVTLPLNKGTLVKIVGAGLKLDAPDAIEMLGNYGGFSVSNVVAQRYGVIPKITPITAPTDRVLGMTLFDCRETDENNEQLKYNPRKAAEMEVVLSGQAMPVVKRGTFSYSGVTTGNQTAPAIGTGATVYIKAGQPLFPESGGALTTYPYTFMSIGGGTGISGHSIGHTLGDVDVNGTTVVWLDIR